MTAPKGYVDSGYLDALTVLTQAAKQRSHALLGLHAGGRVLDVGCGPGSDTLALAQWVGPTGTVCGVDYDPEMVAEANRRAAEAGVAGWTRHERAAAQALPFADGDFDAVRSERMLQHLPEPEPAMAELLRVTRPGGRVVVVDSDWGSLSIQMGDAGLERKLVTVQQFERNHNSFSGRRLPGQLAAAGLGDLHVEVFPLMTTRLPVAQRILGFEGMEQLALDLGRVTVAELARWRAGLAAADAGGTFYFCLNMVLVAGTVGGGA